MAKQKESMSKLGKQHIANHLKRFYPWLKDDYRPIKKAELSDKNFEKVFDEVLAEDLQHLMKDEPTRWKGIYLDALYRYQQCDTKTRETSTIERSMNLPKE